MSGTASRDTRAGAAPAPRPRPVLRALTGLRFVAAFAVVLFHFVPRGSPAPGPLMRLVDSGYVGVSLFFVLSGFVLAYSYLDPANGSLRGSARDFWWARVARVYPVYLLALAASAPEVVRPLLASDAPERASRAAAAVFLAPALLQSWSPRAACLWNCPGWSLSVEAAFYLIFPVAGVWLARAGPRRAFGRAGVAWVLGVALAAAYLAVKPDGIAAPTNADSGIWLNALKFNPVAHVPEFLAGVALGVWFVSPAGLALDPGAPLGRRLRTAAGCAVAATGAFLVLVPEVPFVVLHTGLLAPVWVLVIVALATGGGPVAAALSSRPMVRLGEASYALYLFHDPVGAAVRALLTDRGGSRVPPEIVLAVQIAAVTAVSLGVFAWVERPARTYLRRRRPPLPAPVAAAA